MFKVILKTALKTLLAVLILALVAFGIASLGFPSEMAGLCEKTGNYKMALGYANLSYSYSGSPSDLNRCFMDGVYAGSDGDIVKYGDKLIACEEFDDICAEKSAALESDYRQYVYGKIASAKYRKGSVDEALAMATEATDDMQGFPLNNALAALSLEVIAKSDAGTAARLLEKVVEKTPMEEESEYYGVLKTQLEGVGG